MRREVLLVIFAVMARVGVFGGKTLPQCVGGCLHIQEEAIKNVTCEGFPVNATVQWEVYKQTQSTASRSLFFGTCAPLPESCVPPNHVKRDGFTLSRHQPGNVSVLTINFDKLHRSLNNHTILCNWVGQMADCFINYSPCPPTTTTAETPVNSSEATSDATTVNTSGFPDGSSLNVPPVAAIAGGAGAAVVILIISVVVVIICKRKGSDNRKASEPFVEFKNQEIPQANDPSEDDVENVQDTDKAMNGLYAVVDKNKKTNNKTKESTGTNGRTGLVQPSSNNAIGRESHVYVNDSILVKASNSQEPDSAGEATDAEAMYSIVEKPWKAKPIAAVTPVQTAKASTLPSNLSTSNPSRQHQHTEDEYNAISFTERRSVPGAVHHDYSHIGHASPMNLSVPDLQSQQTDGQYNTLGYTEQRSAPEGLQADYSHIGHASPMNLSVPDLQSQPTDGQYNTLGFTEQRSAPDGLQADYSHVGQAFPVSRSTSDLQQPDTDDQYNTPSG